MPPIRAHFDGKVFVPDEPVTVPQGTLVQVVVTLAEQRSKLEPGHRPLAGLAELLGRLPSDSDLPDDASINVDHYLYNLPKSDDE